MLCWFGFAGYGSGTPPPEAPPVTLALSILSGSTVNTLERFNFTDTVNYKRGQSISLSKNGTTSKYPVNTSTAAAQGLF